MFMVFADTFCFVGNEGTAEKQISVRLICIIECNSSTCKDHMYSSIKSGFHIAAASFGSFKTKGVCLSVSKY